MTQPAVTPGGQTVTVDTPGLALAVQSMVQQQQAIATDVSAMRADVAKALTRLEVSDAQLQGIVGQLQDHEARLRVREAIAVPTDHEGRLRALEKFRYTVGGLALAGGAAAGWVAEWAAQHVH